LPILRSPESADHPWFPVSGHGTHRIHGNDHSIHLAGNRQGDRQFQWVQWVQWMLWLLFVIATEPTESTETIIQFRDP